MDGEMSSFTTTGESGAVSVTVNDLVTLADRILRASGEDEGYARTVEARPTDAASTVSRSGRSCRPGKEGAGPVGAIHLGGITNVRSPFDMTDEEAEAELEREITAFAQEIVKVRWML